MSRFCESFIPYRISETPNGNVMHVGSIQHQNFFMPNEVQMPQVMLPYQPFPSPSVGPQPPMPPQTPTPVMQPALGAAEMLWRPPTVAVANANNNSTAGNGYYYHHRPDEQHISYSSCGGVPSENGSNNEYRQMGIERMVIRHQRGSRGHTENRQAEAAVYQHFEESLKLAQQQRVTFIPYRISETPNGNVMHVGSIQHQNFFMPNEVQMPQVMLPYQPFPSPSVGPQPPMLPQSPAPVMQPALGAAEMLWRPPTVAVANANNYPTTANSYYHHHRPNEQYKSNSNRGNVENDAYKTMKIAKQLQYAQRSAGGSKSGNGGVPSNNGSSNEYGQVEIGISGIRTHHHKLKKAWLQRHIWAEDLNAAGVNIDQNSSHSISQMDDTPPVLQCEIIKKRKISKSLSDDNTEVTLPSTSSTLYEMSTSQDTTQKCRKRKTRIITDNAAHSETEKRVPRIKILIKRGRKPKYVVSIPLKNRKNNDDEVWFFNIFKNQYNIATNKSLF